MKRKKEIVILSHCIINCNSKVEGLSLYGGSLNFVKDLIDRNFGIIQLPCPEMNMYGLKRWGNSKEQFDNLYFREKCRELLMPYIYQFENYLKSDYTLKGIIAIDGSPSCGLNKTCSSSLFKNTLCDYPNSIIENETVSLIDESGVFIEVLKELLNEYKIEIPFVALDESDVESSTNELLEFFK